MEINTMQAGIALVITIVGGTVATTSYFVTKESHEKEMVVMEQQSGDIYRGIRIEQLEDRVYILEEARKGRALTTDEKIRLDAAQESLKELYKQEERR